MKVKVNSSSATKFAPASVTVTSNCELPHDVEAFYVSSEIEIATEEVVRSVPENFDSE